MKKAALTLLSLVFFISNVYAKDFHPTIVLQDLQAIKLNEKKGDEVYINVTEYLPNGKSNSTNIPLPPFAWASKDLPKVKDLKLWNTTLAEGQSADVIITFIEQDNPPFDPDDLLGVVQLKLVNAKGKLKTLWTVKEGSINAKTNKIIDSNIQNFTLKGSVAEYKASLILTE